ncbi:MAG: hypothetical protein M3O87_03485, partial [Candidatus Dormibacteraeota bacterium]|nr:hypothetical protein [Candidatus Dormibacteraeota bacterium]
VDILLAGVTGRGYTHDYWKRLLPKLEPATVVASHFDDFFRMVDDPMGFATNVHLAGVPDEIARVSRDFQVAALPLLQPVGAAPPGTRAGSRRGRAAGGTGHKPATARRLSGGSKDDLPSSGQ